MAPNYEQVINRLFRDSLKTDISFRNISVPGSLSNVILLRSLRAKMLPFCLRKLPRFNNPQIDLWQYVPKKTLSFVSQRWRGGGGGSEEVITWWQIASARWPHLRTKVASWVVLEDFRGSGVFRWPASWAGKMVKMLASNPDDLGTTWWKEGENGFLQAVL